MSPSQSGHVRDLFGFKQASSWPGSALPGLRAVLWAAPGSDHRVWWLDYAKGKAEDCIRAFAIALGFEEVEFVN